ncbi:MAG: hypothetical protein AAGU02_02110, partial [Lawsonibacter sp.]
KRSRPVSLLTLKGKYGMKKHMLIGAIALLLVCLSACGAKSDSGSPSVTGSGASFSASSAPGASSSQAPELPAAWTPYLEVLRGEAEFYSVIIGRNLDMAHLKDAITPDDQPLAAVKEFAAVDLDRDGKEEIILRVAFGDNDNAGFVILHETDGYIYGYSVVLQLFQRSRRPRVRSPLLYRRGA